MTLPLFGLKEQKSLVELNSANGCMRSINPGFQRKLLERMIIPKTSHFQTLGTFAVSKQNRFVYSAAHARAEMI